MTLSVLLYFAVTLSVAPVAAPNGGPNPNIERVLLILATAYVGISIPAKHWLLAQAQSVDSDKLRNLALIAPLVLCEAAAITGLALHFAMGSPHSYVFLLLGLAGMLLHFPRSSRPD